MNVGARIKQRRIELGIDADTLAEKIGKSRATIYRYENGDIENMPTTVLEPIARALNTTPAYLMGWEEKWDKEVKEYFDKMNAFEAELSSLGWTYDFHGCYLWSQYNEGLKLDDEGVFSPDGTNDLIGCNDQKCTECPNKEYYYLFSKGEISFKVSSDDFCTFIDDSQAFFKNRLEKLYDKYNNFIKTELFSDNDSLLPNAAHNRTGVEIKEEERLDDENMID